MAVGDMVLWKRLCYALLALLSVQGILLLKGFAGTPSASFATRPKIPQVEQQAKASLHDRYADSLTAEECSATFPKLFYEIDRSTQHWKERNLSISAQDVDISWHPTGMFDGGALRILIHNNRIRILESLNAMRNLDYMERGLGIINLLQRALQSATAGGQHLPTIEAAIVLQDWSFPPVNGSGTETFWTWTRGFANATQDRLWLVPNFDFWATAPIGSFVDNQDLAVQHDATPKIPKAVWRGTISIWLLGHYLREGLVNATKGKYWADVRNTTKGNPANEQNVLEVDDYCNYLMTIHTEGVSYSGRLKYLLNCNSLPIIHDLHWTTHYYHLLVPAGPEQNFVSVKRDFTDLEEKVLYYLDHPEETQRIIDNHLKTFREHYLTKAAISCYLRRLIESYATVAFEPEVMMTTLDGHQKLRGRLFEEYINKPEDFK